MMKWLSALISLMDDLMSLQNHDQKIKKKKKLNYDCQYCMPITKENA